MIKKLVLTLLFLLLIVTDSYSDCRDILKDGIYNTVVRDSSIRNTQYHVRWICSQIYDRSDREKTGQIKASYYAITGDTNFSETKLSEFQNKYCSQITNISSSEEEIFIFSQIASPDIVKAWLACKTQNQNRLGGIVEQTGRDIFRLKLHFNAGVGNSFSIIEKDYVNLRGIGPKLPKEIKKSSEDTPIQRVFRREDARTESLFFISGKDTLGNQSEILIFIPPMIPCSAIPDPEMLALKKMFTKNTSDVQSWQDDLGLPPGCWHRCRNERMTPLTLTISEDKNRLSYAYRSERPFCEGQCPDRYGESRPTYQAVITADLSISGGVVSVSNVINTSSYNRHQSRAGDSLMAFIKSKDGSALATRRRGECID